MKKILVTGGAGFIGSHTVTELISAGYEPVIVDDFSNTDERILLGLRELLGRDVTIYRFNCADKTELESVFDKEGITGVIHFAAFKAVGESVEHPLKYYRNNIDTLLTLLEVMQAREITDLVFSSSCTVYGQPDINPVLETTPIKTANSPYGYSKQVCERIISDAAIAWPSLRAVMLRYFNPIGAHPSGLIGELPYGVPNNLVPYITQTAAGIRPVLSIFGNDYNTEDGTCIRDFIHVMDLANAHVRALQFLSQSDCSCEVFNLGQGRGDSVLHVVRTFTAVTGVPVNYRIASRRPGDVEQIWADVSKANSLMHWKTERSLEEALRDSWNWQLKIQDRISA